MELLTNILSSMVTSATPLLLAAMGGIIAQRAGMLNIALEGMMLFGAFGSVVIAHLTGNVVLGIVGAMLSGASLAFVFSVLTIYLRANIIVVGLGANLLATALSAYLLPTFLGVWGVYKPPALPVLTKLSIPGIDAIPILKGVFSGHSFLVYFSWLSIVLTSVILFRTIWGIHVRAAGEDPETARAAGIPVTRIQFQALIVSGLLAGLGGAQLALGDLGFFDKHMIAGRGFIALAAFYFGGFRPAMSAVACFLFGLFDAIKYRLQGIGIPPQLIHMAPYILVSLSLVFVQLRGYLRIPKKNRKLKKL